jgi:hypothetical protein
MHYEYELTPRPVSLGGGWKLRLLEDGQEVGGGAFPLLWSLDDPHLGIAWWNSLPEDVRAHWLKVAGSAVPADAWLAYMTEESRVDALEEGAAWLDDMTGYAG